VRRRDVDDVDVCPKDGTNTGRNQERSLKRKLTVHDHLEIPLLAFQLEQQRLSLGERNSLVLHREDRGAMSPEEKEEHVGRMVKDILLVSHRVPSLLRLLYLGWCCSARQSSICKLLTYDL
jgi:hypothetical protein